MSDLNAARARNAARPPVRLTEQQMEPLVEFFRVLWDIRVRERRAKAAALSARRAARGRAS